MFGAGSAVRVFRASPDDWARVRALRLAALADTPDAFWSHYDDEVEQPEAFWRERLEQSDADTLIAVVEGTHGHADVALLTLVPPRAVEADADADDALWVVSVWVAPQGRGRGVGDALLDAAADHARRRGIARLVLDVGDHNEAAIRLYHRHGYEPTGEAFTFPEPRQHITEHRRQKLL